MSIITYYVAYCLAGINCEDQPVLRGVRPFFSGILIILKES